MKITITGKKTEPNDKIANAIFLFVKFVLRLAVVVHGVGVFKQTRPTRKPYQSEPTFDVEITVKESK